MECGSLLPLCFRPARCHPKAPASWRTPNAGAWQFKLSPNCAKRMECVELAPALLSPRRCHPKAPASWRTPNAGAWQFKPSPNCAKRLECVELAPAFPRPAAAIRKRQQAGALQTLARGSSNRHRTARSVWSAGACSRFSSPRRCHTKAPASWRTPNAGAWQFKPSPNCAKRMECGSLLPLYFEPPAAIRQRQQAGALQTLARGSSNRHRTARSVWSAGACSRFTFAPPLPSDSASKLAHSKRWRVAVQTVTELREAYGVRELAPALLRTTRCHTKAPASWRTPNAGAWQFKPSPNCAKRMECGSLLPLFLAPPLPYESASKLAHSKRWRVAVQTVTELREAYGVRELAPALLSPRRCHTKAPASWRTPNAGAWQFKLSPNCAKRLECGSLLPLSSPRRCPTKAPASWRTPNASRGSSPVIMVEHAGQQDHLGMGRRQLGQDQPDARAIGGELLAQRPQVVHLVPVEFLEVQHQAALAARQ